MSRCDQYSAGGDPKNDDPIVIKVMILGPWLFAWDQGKNLERLEARKIQARYTSSCEIFRIPALRCKNGLISATGSGLN